MLNAHTATRTFRELQFDIKAFLTALYNIMPAEGHEDEGLVEIKWADGSVDIVPTFALIRSICNSTYMKLLIGGVAELIPEATTYPVQNGKYYRTTMKLIIQSAPLKVPVREIGSEEEDLEFIKGVIGELVADDVSLPYDADIATIKVDGSLTTSYCNVNDTAKIGSLSCDSGSLQRYNDKEVIDPTLNLSNVQLSVPIRVIEQYRQGYDISRWTQLVGSTVMRPLYMVTGNFRFGGDKSEADWFHLSRKGAGINVAIPLLPSSSADYARTKFTEFGTDYLTPLPLNSPPSLTMLYPLKDTSYNNMTGYLRLKLLPPKATESNMIVTIQNPTGRAIRACNAWSFGRLVKKSEPTNWRSLVFTSGAALGAAIAGVGSIFGGGSSRNEGSSNTSDDYDGEVVALNYIKLPPYSAIDFLFTWSIKGKNLWEAYMLPMTTRTLNIGADD